MAIIQYLLNIIQFLLEQNYCLILILCKYVPLKQWAHDEIHSPKYKKFSTDTLPKVIYPAQDWDWKDLLEYYEKRYHKKIRPVRRHKGKVCDIPSECTCPACNAPSDYLYRNNGSHGQLLCKVCQTAFSPDKNRFEKRMILRCPYCDHTLAPIKDRKFFRIHKCINPDCSFYLHNLNKVEKQHLQEEHGKYRYKLHYIYREFTVDFFKMDLDSLPKHASSLRFTKHNQEIMGLCLTYHVNLQLSLRKTAQALRDIHGIDISHQQVANYCYTAAACVKPFVDHYNYELGNEFIADETYIKVRGVKGYVWIVMDKLSRSVIGYRVSDNRSVGPCILAMRMAFEKLGNRLPDDFHFIADGFSAYPLAAQQFLREFGDKMKFEITQVIGLTNDDEVSKEFRPHKQIVERLNRTYKATYRGTNGFHGFEGANYNVSLWVAYYNFLRPHAHTNFRPLNRVKELEDICHGHMPGKWQMLIYLGQKELLRIQEEKQKQVN